MLYIYISALESEAEKVKMAEIYEKYKFIMLRYALSITNSQENAEDAVHDAFLSVIKHKEKMFSLPEKQLRAVIVIITKNKSIDILRKQNRVDSDIGEDFFYSTESNEMPVEGKVILRDEYEHLRKLISQLDESSRLVLEMKYVIGMSYKEIAEELGIIAKHVDTKIMRAKEKVRNLIKKGGGAV